MFHVFGKGVSRGWIIVLIAWAVLVSGLIAIAPSWDRVVFDREFAYLPETAPSRRAEELFGAAFPALMQPSSIVIVVRRDDGPLTERDKDFIANDLTAGIEQIAAKEGGLATKRQARLEHHRCSTIAIIRSFKDPGIGALLISPDKKAAIIDLEMNTELLEQRNWATLEKIDDCIAKLRRDGKTPEGLTVAHTGSASIGRDVTVAQKQSADATEFWTILLVVILLLLIYRAPLLALVPLLTVAVAVEVALKFLSLLAEANYVTLFEGIQTFITVMLYGTGVDYALFLIARYREELRKDDLTEREAIAEAIGKVGAALLASSATVTCAIAMMIFAQFGQFHYAGIAISSSLFIGLCAVLTLAPALLRLCGRWAFWPYRPHGQGKTGIGPDPALGRWWHKLAALLEVRPALIWTVTVLLMLPLAVWAGVNQQNLEFDLVKRLPGNVPSFAGTKALQGEFPEGVIGPIVVLIRQPDINFAEDRGEDLIATLTDRLGKRRKELGLADIRSLTRPLGMTQQALDALDDLAVKAQESNDAKTTRKMRQEILKAYVSGGDATQMQFVLQQNPLEKSSLILLDNLEKAVRDELPTALHDAKLDFLGLTPSIRDLRQVTDRDQILIELLVTGCVLLILLLLLRQLLVSLYLIASVLLSFYTTLGATFAVFWMLDPSGFSGLDWKVPVFLFTILVAVGEDYNIFLMSRIHEEQETHGPVRGVTMALVKTGRIITSCGIIMVGTFSALLAGSLIDLKQLGFSLALGVLLDTFVVRPILVPTFLIMIYRRHLAKPTPSWNFGLRSARRVKTVAEPHS